MTKYEVAKLTFGKYNIKVIPLIGMDSVEEINELIENGWKLEWIG